MVICVFIQTFIFALSLILSFSFFPVWIHYYYLLNAFPQVSHAAPAGAIPRDLQLFQFICPIYNEEKCNPPVGGCPAQPWRSLRDRKSKRFLSWTILTTPGSQESIK